jgi:hypothetical protein
MKAASRSAKVALGGTESASGRRARATPAQLPLSTALRGPYADHVSVTTGNFSVSASWPGAPQTPRNAASRLAMSSGKGDVNSISSPVTGC